jgi:hypothetical protein
LLFEKPIMQRQKTSAKLIASTEDLSDIDDEFQPMDIVEEITSNQTLHEEPPNQTMERLESIESTSQHPLIKPLNKLINILFELRDTEATYVFSILKCAEILKELRYSPFKSIRKFVSSPGFATIHTSLMQLLITSQQLLNKFRTGISNLETIDRKDVDVCLQGVMQASIVVFDAFDTYSPFFPLYSQFIIAHAETLSMYDELVASDADFLENVKLRCEFSLGESLPSMLIKPVQRLPRYVLLGKEIVNSFENIQKNYDVLECSELHALVKRSVDVFKLIAWSAKQCNDVVRENQDCIRLHELLRLLQLGTELTRPDVYDNLVAKGRQILKEGVLTRHHKHAGMKEHHCVLLSDCFLCCSVNGNGLRLESIQSFRNALCFPVPPTNQVMTECTWFVIAQGDKTLYCDAKSVSERDRWVDQIQSCIENFPSDADNLYNVKLISLVNSMIDDINLKQSNNAVDSDDEDLEEDLPPRGVMLSRFDSVKALVDNEKIDLGPYSIQSFWWHLVDVLEIIGSNSLDIHGNSGNSGQVSLYRQKIRHIEREILAEIVLSAKDDVDGKASTVMAQLLMNQQSHYYIASGWFVEPVGSGSGSLSAGDRPRLLKLVLFSDVIIGLTVDRGVAPLTFAFSISLSDVQFEDYQDGSSDCAMCLIDKSAPGEAQRRMSVANIMRASSKVRKRIIYAPKQNVKFDWLVLIAEAIKSHTSPKLVDSLSAAVYRSNINRVVAGHGSPTWASEPAINVNNND